jgi:hypothetical protein
MRLMQTQETAPLYGSLEEEVLEDFSVVRSVFRSPAASGRMRYIFKASVYSTALSQKAC